MAGPAANSTSELAFLLSQLPSFNGCPISTAASYPLGAIRATMAAIMGPASSLPDLLVSGSSATHAFVYMPDGTFSYVADFLFSPQEAAASSSMRELLAVAHALSRDGHLFVTTGVRTIYWQTDSQVAARFTSVMCSHF